MKYPKVLGYELIQQIGGGGYSRVFRAVNVEQHSVAACKLMHIDENTTEKERKTMDKEMQIHLALKHKNVLEFLNAVVVEPKFKAHYVPGVYMLLEFAAGGDLFDKIVPDVGVGDEVAHLYFNQLLAELHPWSRCLSPRFETGKFTSGCGRNAQNIRFRAICSLQVDRDRKNPPSQRTLRQYAVHRSRGERQPTISS